MRAQRSRRRQSGISAVCLVAALALVSCHAEVKDGLIEIGPCGPKASLRLAYASNTSFEEEGTLVGLGTDGREHALSRSGGAYDLDFSPDGTRIAFNWVGPGGGVSDISGHTDLSLWTANADGSHRRQVTSGHEDFAPAWSPDGSSIAFDRKVGSAHRIAVVPAAGGAVRLFPARAGSSDRSPTWSPDGREVAYAETEPATVDTARPVARLVVANADGSRSRTLVTRRDVKDPAWSPDGRRIAFWELPDPHLAQEDDGRVETADVDSRVVHQVASPARYPAWSSRGGRLYFFGRSPAARDFTDEWRIVEKVPGAAAGVVVPGTRPIAYDYNYAVAVPRCHPAGSEALTTASDAPTVIRVHDPVQRKTLTVMSRAAAIERAYVGTSVPRRSTDQVMAKLVDAGRFGYGHLVWVVVVTPEDGRWVARVFEAPDGGERSSSTGDPGSPEPPWWAALEDLAR